MPFQIDQFARMLAHDLRSPITTACEALAISETVEPATAHRFRQIARQNLCRAEKIVSGIQGFARVGDELVPKGRFSVREYLEEVVSEIRVSSLTNLPEIKLVGEFGELHCNPDRFAFVFRNLIRNAIIHNSDRPDLIVEVGRSRDQDSEFYVRDNGRGIPPNDQANIFKPFTLLEESDGEGLGLGLSLVEIILQQIGGSIWVESGPSRGSTFWVRWLRPS